MCSIHSSQYCHFQVSIHGTYGLDIAQHRPQLCGVGILKLMSGIAQKTIRLAGKTRRIYHHLSAKLNAVKVLQTVAYESSQTFSLAFSCRSLPKRSLVTSLRNLCPAGKWNTNLIVAQCSTIPSIMATSRWWHSGKFFTSSLNLFASSSDALLEVCREFGGCFWL